MEPTKKYIVITTINSKSEAIEAFEQRKDWHIVVVADEKSECIASSDNLTFLGVEGQLKSGYQFARQCPFSNYARKNIGYLYAIQQGADVIYDTDDDNIPYPEWSLPPFTCDNVVVSRDKYVNIYKYFTDEFIWPRGFPFDEIRNSRHNELSLKSAGAKIGAWQGLTDDDPDTDAIYRLVINQKIKFDRKGAVYLEKDSYCPINSQNTFWRKSAFPYLYLPATVSFRFTDILRGYIAQRLMWREDLHVGFTNATVYQKRNPHDVIKDFSDECESYLRIKRIVEILESLRVSDYPFENMQEVYKELCKNSILNADELKYLNLWIEDYKNLI